MKWEKIGKIFDPSEHPLGEGFVGFAQSPQALVFDGFVRIYFSSRKKDPQNDKFLSHIAFVDMDKTLRSVLGVSKHPVIPLGGLGCFDEHGIFPMNVLRHGKNIYGYTCGWNRKVSVSVDTAIGFAESHDQGLTFQKNGDGPILASSLHEPFLVGDPFVSVYDHLFHMWYIYGTEWKRRAQQENPERIYKIAHATSLDGINWHREGRQIISDNFPEESQALPTVIAFNGTYHMFFCYRQSFDFRENRNRAYRIGYAYSFDLLHWTRDDAEGGIEGTERSWDADMLCYPHVFRCDDKICLLYNGNEFGRHGFGLAELQTSSTDWVSKTNKASKEQIAAHLEECSDQFIPPLMDRVELREYSKKLSEKSVTFEAWHQNRLIGLLSAYFNDPQKRTGFITSVSTVPAFMGKGVASTLLKQCKEYARAGGFAAIHLEVSPKNSSAVRLYQKHGFTKHEQKADSLFMQLEVHQGRDAHDRTTRL
jgi:ribosomal protein S18 acetylase RimI-like enzyme